MRIGIDLLGSDCSPHLIVEAVQEVVEQLPDGFSMLLFGTKDLVQVHPRIEWHVVSQTITMDDEPLSAIRLKKDSSLVAGIRHLKEKKIDAFISAGNTGALVAGSTLALPLLPGVERPALLAVLPTEEASLAMIDVGGTTTARADLLVQYAHMGAAYQRCRLGIETPKIGLLNIGAESKKGTSEVRKAYSILKEQSEQPGAKVQFVGNVEGREIFQGKIDVLVTDGFTGNVMLKTTEGISSFIFNFLKKKAPSLQLNELRSHFDYDEYPGAIVCGVDGIVIKCHGSTSKKGIASSIHGAVSLLQNNLLTHLKHDF